MTNRTNGHANAAMDQAVSECFGALLAAIRTSADDWRLRAAEALVAREDTKVHEYLPAIQRISEAAGEVEALYLKWRDQWPSQATPTAAAQKLKPHTKQQGSKLRVHLNGQVVECSDAAETFARTLEQFGLERVARLGKHLSGIPLVGTSKTSDYQSQTRIGGFFVCTHSNTHLKKVLLEEIAAELKVPIRVEITSKHQAP